jgi:hypothetical protein
MSGASRPKRLYAVYVRRAKKALRPVRISRLAAADYTRDD